MKKMKKIIIAGITFCAFNVVMAQNSKSTKAVKPVINASDTSLPKKAVSDTAKVAKDGGGFKVGKIQKSPVSTKSTSNSSNFLPVPGKENTSLSDKGKSGQKKG